jgi:hypothetical protein
MENKIVTVLFFFFNIAFCQVGINTTSPKATLDVVGKPSNASEIDGIITPRITCDELISKDVIYGIDQMGVIVYVTAISQSSSPKTINIDDIGYYYFDGAVWLKLSHRSLHEIGDIKSCLINSDHNGWIKLDGRAISSLSMSQQSNAALLGLVNNLPDANGKILSQGGVLGNVLSPSLLEQNQLPNVVLSGSTSIDGVHTHNVDPSSTVTSSSGDHTHASNASGTPGNFGLIRRSLFYQNVTATVFDTGGSGYEPDISSTVGGLAISNSGSHDHVIDLPITQSSPEGLHNHTVITTSINGNTIQKPLSIENLPRLNVNMFVYLGK